MLALGSVLIVIGALMMFGLSLYAGAMTDDLFAAVVVFLIGALFAWAGRSIRESVERERYEAEQRQLARDGVIEELRRKVAQLEADRD